MDNDFFAPPAFRPAEALIQLKRQLRELRPLVARGDAAFDWQGQAVIELSASADAIHASLAKQPSRAPEWSVQHLKSSADVRRWLDGVKQQVTRWSDD